jgi:uncharacterized membrane protein
MLGATPNPQEVRRMATLTVWKFDNPNGADDAVARLQKLSKQELIKIHDAATVSWEPGKKRPKTNQLGSITGASALGGAFWGLLFGLLFFIPILGMAIGAAAGAIGGSLTDVGIDDDFISEVRTKITPGTSALFVMSSDAVLDKVQEAFEDTHAELIKTNLSDAEEAKLREVFSED